MNNEQLFQNMFGVSYADWSEQAFRQSTGLIDARRDDGCVPVITTLHNNPKWV